MFRKSRRFLIITALVAAIALVFAAAAYAATISPHTQNGPRRRRGVLEHDVVGNVSVHRYFLLRRWHEHAPAAYEQYVTHVH